MTSVCQPVDCCIVLPWKAAVRASSAMYVASHTKENPFESFELDTGMGVSKSLVGPWAKAAKDHIFRRSMWGRLHEETSSHDERSMSSSPATPSGTLPASALVHSSGMATAGDETKKRAVPDDADWCWVGVNCAFGMSRTLCVQNCCCGCCWDTSCMRWGHACTRSPLLPLEWPRWPLTPWTGPPAPELDASASALPPAAPGKPGTVAGKEDGTAFCGAAGCGACARVRPRQVKSATGREWPRRIPGPCCGCWAVALLLPPCWLLRPRATKAWPRLPHNLHGGLPLLWTFPTLPPQMPAALAFSVPWPCHPSLPLRAESTAPRPFSSISDCCDVALGETERERVHVSPRLRAEPDWLQPGTCCAHKTCTYLAIQNVLWTHIFQRQRSPKHRAASAYQQAQQHNWGYTSFELGHVPWACGCLNFPDILSEWRCYLLQSEALSRQCSSILLCRPNFVPVFILRSMNPPLEFVGLSTSPQGMQDLPKLFLDGVVWSFCQIFRVSA